MKKLFTLALIGVFSTFLTSCSNTGTADLYPEGVNQTHQNDAKAASRSSEGESLLTYEEAVEATKKDKTLIIYNNLTKQIMQDGIILPNIEPVADRMVKTICKVKKMDGTVIAINHVYDNHYSGYEISVTSGSGSYSSPHNSYFPTDCLSLWAQAWS